MNYYGNVEGKELFGGLADVAITDGFTGNVLLKSSEAVAKLMTEILKTELKSSPLTMLGALLAKPAFGRLKAMLDPSEQGAAPLLGIDGMRGTPVPLDIGSCRSWHWQFLLGSAPFFLCRRFFSLRQQQNRQRWTAGRSC